MLEPGSQQVFIVAHSVVVASPEYQASSCSLLYSYSHFSLDHYARCYLNDARGENQAHDAADDASKSIRVFNAHLSLMQNPAALAEMTKVIQTTPPFDSFAKRHPVWEECCMGNKKLCTCGAPFFG
jgi:hypothetical protein